MRKKNENVCVVDANNGVTNRLSAGAMKLVMVDIAKKPAAMKNGIS